MLGALKDNRSLTFYQPTGDKSYHILTTANAGGLSSVAIATNIHLTSSTTAAFNNQYRQYIASCQMRQQELLDKTSQHMQKIYDAVPSPSASKLRDSGNWDAVKRLVDREELMKLQISQKTDFPMTDNERKALLKVIQDKNLATMTDKEIKTLLDSVVKRDERAMMDALKQFKETGKASYLLQEGKLDELKRELADIDLSKISNDQFKHLRENFCERTEYHHRTGVSADASKQSLADNISPLKTSDHDKKHFDPETEKTDYKKAVTEPELNRTQEIKNGNQKRVLRNELQGLGLAAAIGVGIGFTIGFATALAQSGTSPDSIKMALGAGAKGGLESGALSTVGYGIERTIGQTASAAVTGLLGNLGMEVTENVAAMCSMGTVGAITITVFSAYQFAKLKLQGADTHEALFQVGKQAAFSFSLLAGSIIAQGVFGGAAGLIVSVGAGICMVSYSAVSTVHQRQLAEELQIYTIEKCKPVFAG